MGNHLIQLKNGILVEVEEVPGRQRPIAAGGIDKVEKGLDQLRTVLDRIATAMKETWDATKAAHVAIEQIEMELGLSFEAEGNLFITKAKGGANLVLKLTAKGTSS